MDHDRVLGELVEVGYRLYKDRGSCGHAGKFARANGLEDGEERVGILADSDNLREDERFGSVETANYPDIPLGVSCTQR